MIQHEVIHETNVAGSHGGLAFLCFLRRGRALFRRNGIAPATTAQMTDGDMEIVPQIRVAFIDRAKVNEVVLVHQVVMANGFHPFTTKYLFLGRSILMSFARGLSTFHYFLRGLFIKYTTEREWIIGCSFRFLRWYFCCRDQYFFFMFYFWFSREKIF